MSDPGPISKPEGNREIKMVSPVVDIDKLGPIEPGSVIVMRELPARDIDQAAYAQSLMHGLRKVAGHDQFLVVALPSEAAMELIPPEAAQAFIDHVIEQWRIVSDRVDRSGEGGERTG